MNLNKFFCKKNLNNQLDFFKAFNPPQNTKINKWLILSAVSFACLLATLHTINTNKKTELSLIKNQNVTTQAKNNVLKEKIKLLHDTKSESETLENKIAKIEKSLQNQNYPSQLLTILSQSVPENSWLTGVKMVLSKTESNKEKQIEIEGQTKSEEDIVKFSQNLSEQKMLSNLQITNIQKVKRSKKSKTDNKQKQTNLYSFKLLATIESC